MRAADLELQDALTTSVRRVVEHNLLPGTELAEVVHAGASLVVRVNDTSELLEEDHGLVVPWHLQRWARYVPAGTTAVVQQLPGADGDVLLVCFVSDVDPVDGDPGTPGSSTPTGDTRAAVFVQTSPLAVWSIPYTWAVPPAVTVVDSAGQSIEADVLYDETSHIVTITFGGATSGKAYLT